MKAIDIIIVIAVALSLAGVFLSFALAKRKG